MSFSMEKQIAISFTLFMGYIVVHRRLVLCISDWAFWGILRWLSILFCFLIIYLASEKKNCSFWGHTYAYGSSQVRSRIGAAAARQATATTTWDLSHMCDLYHSSLSEARDRAPILRDNSWVHNPLSHHGNFPKFFNVYEYEVVFISVRYAQRWNSVLNFNLNRNFQFIFSQSTSPYTQ